MNQALVLLLHDEFAYSRIVSSQGVETALVSPQRSPASHERKRGADE